METLNPNQILQLGLGFWGAKTLLSAVELGLFTELASGALDEQELRQRLKLHPRSARDFFDALVALGMLEREAGKYRNTPQTDTFLDKRKPSYIGGLLEMVNGRLFRFWDSLTEALKTGQPQNEAKSGGDLFGTLYSNPDTLKSFLQGMTGLSRESGRAIAEKFNWKGRRSFADIGCAQGGVATQIALAHPELKGIGFDLPEVGPIFEAYTRDQGVSDRVRFVSGNFMNEALPEAEVLIMGHILHDWNLEQKKMLLQKAYQALPSGGALIIHEAIIDDERRTNVFGLLMSLNMLIETHGGFDYSGADCRAWLQEAGFRKSSVQHLSGPDSMVIGIK